MKGRCYLSSMGLAALMLVSFMTVDIGRAWAQAKPNFVIILADDLGYGDVSCYGSTIKTPNIDQLAREGVRFTDFHSNGAVCSPTRCALVTGRYQYRAGIPLLVSGEKGLEQDELTIAEVLKTSGYATAIFGKWHLGLLPKFNPVNQGFDEFRGFLGGRLDYFSHTMNREPDWWDGLKALEEKGYTTTLITDNSVDFIRRCKSKPFCLYVSFNAVHTPIQDPQTGETSKTAETFTKMTQAMDDGIGRIIAALKDAGLEKNTLVFFLSDNGSPLVEGSSNKPLRGKKGTTWEGGHRVPAVAWWPGRISPARVSDQTVMSMDIMPTFVEVAGAQVPEGHKLDGVSLASLLFDDQPLSARKLFWSKGANWAMRDGRWKLMIDDSDVYLFDLIDDLSEEKDLAAQQPDRVKTMQAEYMAWAKEVGLDKVPGKGNGGESK